MKKRESLVAETDLDSAGPIKAATTHEEQTNMATLTVFKFETEFGAEQAVEVLEKLQKQQAIQVHDAATIRCPTARKNRRQCT
jgi:hypothetical protein